MVTVTTLCVVLSVWYTVNMRHVISHCYYHYYYHVISQLETASRTTLDKSAAISAERKRSDHILHQMLPKSVVLQLKVNTRPMGLLIYLFARKYEYDMRVK